MVSPWIIGVLISLSVLIGVGSRFFFKRTDNIVEETAEKVIKDHTGVDIDLSPDTPDKDLPGREKSLVMEEPIDVDVSSDMSEE